MQSDTQAAVRLAPLERTDRIEALDVVRGFALIGILLMNIEFFNRPISALGTGMQPGLTGLNWLFAWFVMYFVLGKFWTMFSLLFGMGFGVMLNRAESAGRGFLAPYLRRLAGLALFGAMHYVLVWGGDILFSYAVAALCLLVVLFGRMKYILLTIAALIGGGMAAKIGWTYQIAGCLAYFGVLAWYLRCPDQLTVFGRSVPVFKIVTRFLMLAAAGAIVAGFAMPKLPYEARFMMPYVGALVLVLAVLMVRYHNPDQARPLRVGLAMYIFSCLMMIGIGVQQHYFPNPADAPVAAAVAPAPAQASGAVPKPPVTEAEKAAERGKKRAEAVAENKAGMANEVRLLTTGSYPEVVALRAKRFVERAPGQFGFSTIIVSMFLLGLWFVRSGVMANTRAHMPLFRKLAAFGLPVGIGLGLLGSLISTHAVPGTNDGHLLATGLLRLGNLPACLGYVGLVIVMLNSPSIFSRIKLLAPFGRMALTNYLTHSVVFTLICYGYGLGHYGIERIWQLPCVVAMVALQIPLSHWWLGRFRYGPMEWLWRAITYWNMPPMRVAGAGKRLAGEGQTT